MMKIFLISLLVGGIASALPGLLVDPHIPHGLKDRSDSPVTASDHDLENNLQAKADSVVNSQQLHRRWGLTELDFAPWNVRMVTAGDRIPDYTTGNKPKPDMVSDYGPAQLMSLGGKGVNVYVLDCGIKLTHNFFKTGGNVVNFKNLKNSLWVDTTNDDLDGHGTGVAGVVKSLASQAEIINCKICSDYEVVDAAKAMNDIIDDHMANVKQKTKGFKGSVITMSLHVLEETKQVQEAIKRATDAGIPFVVAAGNTDGENGEQPQKLCTLQPQLVICVGGVTREYKFDKYSVEGEEITVLAPSEDITVPNFEADNLYKAVSGTSFAAPHVAGILANYISYEALSGDTERVLKLLMDNALYGKIETPLPAGTKNILANLGIAKPGKDPNVPYVGAPRGELQNMHEQPPQSTPGVSQITSTTLDSFPHTTVGPASLEPLPTITPL